MIDRPADIISPTSSKVLRTQVVPADARAACGAWNDYESQAAMARMSRAGAELVTSFALGCELQADWKLTSSEAMIEPFTSQLPEYGWVAQNFWNNVNQHAVPDPFGTVK